MSLEFLRDNILLFGPGFVFVKLVYLFGEQHRRLEWEWLVWSLIAGLPIALGAERLTTGTIPSQIPLSPDSTSAAARFGIAVVAAVVVVVGWRMSRHSNFWPVRFVRRSLADSAWDLVLDRAVHDKCGVEITVEGTLDDGEKREIAYYGWLAAFGYETASADPIVVLTDIWRKKPEDGGFKRLLGDDPPEGVPGRHTLVFHREHILRLRVCPPVNSPLNWRDRLRPRWLKRRSHAAASGSQVTVQVTDGTYPVVPANPD